MPRPRRKQREPGPQEAGPGYEPYISVRDVSSTGRSTRSTHPKLPWVTQELSGIETNLRLILEWSDDVKTVWEQYALDLKETLQIAEELGVRHAEIPRKKEPKIMTSDFVIEMKSGEISVVQTKSWNKLTEREVEKLEIERTYWERKSARCIISTDLEIPSILVGNILFVRKYVDLTDYGITAKQVNQIKILAEPLVIKDIALNDIGDSIDERLGFLPGTSLSVFKHLIATKVWDVDMMQPLDPGERLSLRNGHESRDSEVL